MREALEYPNVALVDMLPERTTSASYPFSIISIAEPIAAFLYIKRPSGSVEMLDIELCACLIGVNV